MQATGDLPFEHSTLDFTEQFIQEVTEKTESELVASPPEALVG
jgi:hypothetical protein